MKHRIFILDVEFANHPQRRFSHATGHAVGYTVADSILEAHDQLRRHRDQFYIREITHIGEPSEFLSLDEVKGTKSKDRLRKATAIGCWIEPLGAVLPTQRKGPNLPLLPMPGIRQFTNHRRAPGLAGL